MKYFVFESAVADGAQANGVTVRDDLGQARMLFHQVRASQLANDKVTYGVAMVIDEESHVLEREFHGSIAASLPPEGTDAVDAMDAI